MKRTAIMCLAVACLTFGVAACGSDSDDDSSSSSDTTAKSPDEAQSASSSETTAPDDDITAACEQLDTAQLAAAIPGSTFTLATSEDAPLTSGEGEVVLEHGASCTYTVTGTDVWTGARVGIYSVPEGSTGGELVTEALGPDALGCDAPPIGETSGFFKGLGFAAQGDYVVTAFFEYPIDAAGNDLSENSPVSQCQLVVPLLEAATPLAAG